MTTNNDDGKRPDFAGAAVKRGVCRTTASHGVEKVRRESGRKCKQTKYPWPRCRSQFLTMYPRSDLFAPAKKMEIDCHGFAEGRRCRAGQSHVCYSILRSAGPPRSATPDWPPGVVLFGPGYLVSAAGSLSSRTAQAYLTRLDQREPVALRIRTIFNDQTETGGPLAHAFDVWRTDAPKLTLWAKDNLPEGFQTFIPTRKDFERRSEAIRSSVAEAKPA